MSRYHTCTRVVQCIRVYNNARWCFMLFKLVPGLFERPCPLSPSAHCHSAHPFPRPALLSRTCSLTASLSSLSTAGPRKDIPRVPGWGPCVDLERTPPPSLHDSFVAQVTSGGPRASPEGLSLGSPAGSPGALGPWVWPCRKKGVQVGLGCRVVQVSLPLNAAKAQGGPFWGPAGAGGVVGAGGRGMQSLRLAAWAALDLRLFTGTCAGCTRGHANTRVYQEPWEAPVGF